MYYYYILHCENGLLINHVCVIVIFGKCSPSRAKDSLIYSYGKSMNGFAAKLSDEEVARFSSTRFSNNCVT